MLSMVRGIAPVPVVTAPFVSSAEPASISLTTIFTRASAGFWEMLAESTSPSKIMFASRECASVCSATRSYGGLRCRAAIWRSTSAWLTGSQLSDCRSCSDMAAAARRPRSGPPTPDRLLKSITMTVRSPRCCAAAGRRLQASICGAIRAAHSTLATTRQNRALRSRFTVTENPSEMALQRMPAPFTRGRVLPLGSFKLA